jgi:hypothetical protein
MEPGQFLGYNFDAGTGASEHVGRTRSWQLESPEVFSGLSLLVDAMNWQPA